MKTFNTFKQNILPFFLLGITILLFSSCGTTKNDYDESDGIYSSEKNQVVNTAEEEETKNSYYKQYFKTKELTYKEVPEEDAILTDVEAYYTTETLDQDGYVVEENNYNEGNGSWGTNATEVSINVYGGFGYSPYYYGGWGIGFGWGYPMYGWGYPYYGYGGYYGWGYPHYGYPHYGYGGGYYGGGYYGNGYSYNRGRRNTDYYAGRSSSSRGYTSSRRGNSSSTSRGNYSKSRKGSYTKRESSRRSSSSRINNVRRSGNSTYNKSSKRTTRPSNTYKRSSNSRSNSTYRGSSGGSRGGSYGGGGSRGGGSRGGGGGRRGGI